MRRLVLASLLFLVPVPQAEPRTPVPPQVGPDAVSALVIALQDTLRARHISEFLSAFAPNLPVRVVAALESIATNRSVTGVTLRERLRDDSAVLVEVFIERGDQARIANWRLEIVPGSANRLELRSIEELSVFDELVRLELDAARQYSVHDFSLNGTDFVLTMSSGEAFVANVGAGTTALVLRGRGRVRFSPQSPTEQGQLRVFNGRPALDTETDEVFIRLHPAQFERRIFAGSLRPVAVNPNSLRRARDIFDAQSWRSFHVSLGDLTSDRWSLRPQPGSTLVDFRVRGSGWLTYMQTPDDPEDVALFDRARRRQISLYASPEQQARHGGVYSDDDKAQYVVTHTALDLRFDPDRRWLSGRASLRVFMRQQTPVLTVRLAESLSIASVSSPDFGPLLFLRSIGQNAFIVGLPNPVPAGGGFTLDVDYYGRLDPQPFDREAMQVGAGGPQEIDPDAPGFIFAIEPRFLFSSRDAWYPQGATFRHGTATIRMTVPDEYDVVASGTHTSSAVTPDVDPRGPMGPLVRTVEFRANRPVRYLAALISRFVPAGHASIAVGVHTPDDISSVDVRVLSSPRQANWRRVTADGAGEIVSFYATLIGGAPYPALTIAVLEDTVPGGHSPAYFALLNQSHPATPLRWRSDPVAFDDVRDFFLAHEIAHQWWGQAVGARNYHEQWISEGFAQYFAWMYVESTQGTGPAERLMSRMRSSAVAYAAAGPMTLGYRLGHLRGDPREFRAIVYNKSAVVLHMLRRLVGDEAFRNGTRRLFASSRFKKIGTDDVRRAFQAETTTPLDRFFERWVAGAAIPEVHLDWSIHRAGKATVRITQRGDVFDLPLDVTIHYANGDRDRIPLKVTTASADFEVDTRGAVRRMEIDDATTLVRVVR